MDVQSDLLEPFETRVVIPLIAPRHAPRLAPHRLNPVLKVVGEPRVLATQLLATLLRAELGAPRCDAIRAALDMLFRGF